MHTPVLLKEQILYCMAMWLSESPIEYSHEMLQPIHDQCTIGWQHFFQGRMATSFSQYMHLHYSTNSIPKDGTAWTSVLIQLVWRKFFERQWAHRNEFVHCLNKSKQSTREYINLNFEIRQLYSLEDSLSLLQQDQYLMESPLSELLRKPVSHKKGWLMNMKIAIADRDQYRSKEEAAMSRAMTRFLQNKAKHHQLLRFNSPPQLLPQPAAPALLPLLSGRPFKRRVNTKRRRQITLTKRSRRFFKKRVNNKRRRQITLTIERIGRDLKKRVHMQRRRTMTLENERWEIRRRQKLKK